MFIFAIKRVLFLRDHIQGKLLICTLNTIDTILLSHFVPQCFYILPESIRKTLAF